MSVNATEEPCNARLDDLLGEFGRPDIVATISELYGIVIDDSPQLRALCKRAATMRAPYQVATLVHSALQDAWTYNLNNTGFPDEFGHAESRLWNRVTSDADKPWHLSTLLRERLGFCLSYAFLTGIILKASGLATKVEICEAVEDGVGHLWVEGEDSHQVKFALDVAGAAHTGSFTPTMTRQGGFLL